MPEFIRSSTVRASRCNCSGKEYLEANPGTSTYRYTQIRGDAGLDRRASRCEGIYRRCARLHCSRESGAHCTARSLRTRVGRTAQDFVCHYATAMLPARPRKPQDKAKAEVGVQIVERWILARPRHQRFFSLAE